MIKETYTMLIRIPLYERGGEFFADRLWEKDLSMHLSYISNFRIVCPVERLGKASGPLSRVVGLAEGQVTRLNSDLGWLSVIANIIPNFLHVASAIRNAEIVHTSCAGWPFPLAYYVLLLKPYMKIKWVNVVESSFWVKPTSGKVTLRQQISHYVNEFLVKRCVRASDARIFTQEWYRKVYLNSHKAAMVNAAVWIDKDDFRDANEMDFNQCSELPTRLIYPTRLVPEKGIDVVLSAIERWEEIYSHNSSVVLHIDIIGEGPLAEKCRVFSALRNQSSRLRMRFLEAMPYDSEFFKMLRSYNGAIVANRKAEQARIVFDVMAQGVPCLATRTPGNLAIIKDGETGVLFPIDDVNALAELLERAAQDSSWLRALGRNAFTAAQGFSHTSMHREREIFLREALGLSEAN